MHPSKLLFLLPCILLFSCADKYHAYKSQYQFRSTDGKPDYSDLHYWAAHPWKWDPSDSIPQPLKTEARDTVVDVFFIHPTTHTGRLKNKKRNAGIDDEYINAKTDYSTILYQATVFNAHARVFSPRYRQAHISTFYLKNKVIADNVFDTAYQDVKKAFEYYLAHYHRGRPLIIAGHSQGALLGERLLKEFFEDRPLMDKLVAAYIIGWQVPGNYFTKISLCETPSQTGCLCGWRTFRQGYLPFYIKREAEKSLVINPLTWTASEEYAGKDKNRGSVLFRFNKIFMATTGARTSSGVLWVKKPKFPGSFFYFTRNYHIADINLFYLNIRENIEARIAAYREKNKME